MTISFMAYRHNGKYYVYALPYEAAIDMSNANAYDIIDAVGLETNSSGLLPITRNFATASRRPVGAALTTPRRQSPSQSPRSLDAAPSSIARATKAMSSGASKRNLRPPEPGRRGRRPS